VEKKHIKKEKRKEKKRQPQTWHQMIAARRGLLIVAIQQVSFSLHFSTFNLQDHQNSTAILPEVLCY
jgi:hypothetical protein